METNGTGTSCIGQFCPHMLPNQWWGGGYPIQAHHVEDGLEEVLTDKYSRAFLRTVVVTPSPNDVVQQADGNHNTSTDWLERTPWMLFPVGPHPTSFDTCNESSLPMRNVSQDDNSAKVRRAVNARGPANRGCGPGGKRSGHCIQRWLGGAQTSWPRCLVWVHGPLRKTIRVSRL